MSTRMRHEVLFAIILFIYLDSGVTLLAIDSVAHDHHNQHQQPTLLRKWAAVGSAGHVADFIPDGPSQPPQAATLSSGADEFAGNVDQTSLLAMFSGAAEKSSPVAEAATQPRGFDRSGNLLYVIDGKGMHSQMERKTRTLHSGHQNVEHDVEVGILGSAELARTRTLEKPQLPQGIAEPHYFPKASLLDDSARLLDKQTPTLGMRVRTPMALVAQDASAEKKQLPLLMLIGIGLGASMMAIAAAYILLNQPREQQEASDSGGASLREQRASRSPSPAGETRTKEEGQMHRVPQNFQDKSNRSDSR